MVQNWWHISQVWSLKLDVADPNWPAVVCWTASYSSMYFISVSTSSFGPRTTESGIFRIFCMVRSGLDMGSVKIE